MSNYVISQEQMDAIKEAQKVIKEYNEITGMGLGFASDNNPLSGFLSIFQPRIPPDADGPYPTGLRVEKKLNQLFGEVK